MGCLLHRHMFSAEKTGIKGPCPWPDHCCRGTKRRQDDRNPWVTGSGNGDPDFDDGDQGSDYWGPEAGKKKYASKGGNQLRNHRCRKRRAYKLEDSEANEQDGRQHPLKKQTQPRPTVGES